VGEILTRNQAKAIAIQIVGESMHPDTFADRKIKKWIVVPLISSFYIEKDKYNRYTLNIQAGDDFTVFIYRFERDAERESDNILLALEEFYQEEQ
jgi:hypothetical protein